jgi:hypothetical protein
MGRTKIQREFRDFSMALVIKTHQNNNNKKHRNFVERDRNLSIYFGGPVLFFLLLKKTC